MMKTSEPAWTESASAVWWMAAATFVFCSFCHASLTWDGSYFLLRTLQDEVPFMPAHRWFHWILLEPVLLMRPIVNDPVKLAVIHGLMCSLLPLFSLGSCLAMLRGDNARLRIWPVIGILLVPLPGQIFFVTEVNPTIQLAWILFVFVWQGCSIRWSPIVAIAMMAMSTLHPAAVPLLFFAAIMAAIFGLSREAQFRRRILVWGMIFAAASVAKLVECIILATTYERANMSLIVWITESITAFKYTLFPSLVPVLIDLMLYAWSLFSKQTRLRPLWLSKILWGAAFVFGTICASDSNAWTCAINYRKFVILTSSLVVLLASVDAWRLQRLTTASPEKISQSHIALVYPAILFTFMLSGMALSWQSLCESLKAQLAVHVSPVMEYRELCKPESDSALNHWGSTSLSLILQGWKPTKLFIWDRSSQLSGNHLCICPENALGCENKNFKLGWVAELYSSAPLRNRYHNPQPSHDR